MATPRPAIERTKRPRLTAQFFAGIVVGNFVTVIGDWLWRLTTQG